MSSVVDNLQEYAKTAGSAVGKGVKIAGDKVSETIDSAKIRAKINDENKAIDAELLGIGEYFFGKMDRGELSNEDMALSVETIRQKKARIEELQKELDAVKGK